MLLVYGGPTTGKSTAGDELTKLGYPVLDTDHLVEALVSAPLGLTPEQYTEAWDWWRAQTPEGREPIIAAIRLIIDKTRRPDRPMNLIVFTNLHWPEMKADMAFFRPPELTLIMMKERSERKGRLITPSYEQEILQWTKPDIGSEITELGLGAYIDAEAIADKYGTKHPLI